MKYLFVFVCLAGVLQAQANTLSTAVTSAINTSKASLATAIQQMNSTINTADQSVLVAYGQFVQSIVTAYQSYYDRFKNYSTIDLSALNTTIANFPSNISPPQPLQDWSASQIFTDVQTSAQQIEAALAAAVANITNSVTPCANPKVTACTNTYGPKLSADPITIDRVTDCINAELTRYADIGARMIAQYASVLTSTKNYLMIVDVCDIPAAEVVNNPPINRAPSMQCLTQVSFLTDF